MGILWKFHASEKKINKIKGVTGRQNMRDYYQIPNKYKNPEEWDNNRVR